MKIVHLEASAGGEDVSEPLERDGAVIADAVLSVDQVDDLMADLKPWIENTQQRLAIFAGRNMRRTGALIARSPKCSDIVMHPLALATSSKFLGHATSYQLHLTQVLSIGPGEPAQHIHRDQWAMTSSGFHKGYETQCDNLGHDRFHGT